MNGKHNPHMHRHPAPPIVGLNIGRLGAQVAVQIAYQGAPPVALPIDVPHAINMSAMLIGNAIDATQEFMVQWAKEHVCMDCQIKLDRAQAKAREKLEAAMRQQQGGAPRGEAKLQPIAPAPENATAPAEPAPEAVAPTEPAPTATEDGGGEGKGGAP